MYKVQDLLSYFIYV